MPLRIRLQNVSAFTALALIGLQAGIAPSRVLEMSFTEFAAALADARQRRFS